jgi:hypothetical protein
MPMLDTSKLQGKIGGVWLNGRPTRSTSKGEEYRCPACAMNGGDEGGQHLIVFKERGTFACAAYPGDRAHRNKIWKEAGVDTGNKRSDPVIPAKILQKSTFIGRHVMNMEKEAEAVRERDASLVAAREKAKRLNWMEAMIKHRIKPTQHIDTISNKVQIGTFGTPILSSTNMPPPTNIINTTVGMGRGYAPPTYEKASQTSQVRLAYRKRDGQQVGSYEFDSSDLDAVFDTTRHGWREQYYELWKKKYVMA